MLREPYQNDTPQDEAADGPEPGHDQSFGQTTRRRHGRIRVDRMGSSVGTVLDLSATGIRVISTKSVVRKIGRMFSVTLWTPGDQMEIDVVVVWSTRIGFRRHIAGLRFTNFDEEQGERLARMARTAAVRMSISA
jgi:hypothetical protein